MLSAELLPCYSDPKLELNPPFLVFWILRLRQATQEEIQHLDGGRDFVICCLFFSAGSLADISTLGYNFLSRNGLLRNSTALFNDFLDLLQKHLWSVVLAAVPI